MDRKEEPKMADIKRSIVKDLNPVIDVLPTGKEKAKVGSKGQILFHLMEDDMNGMHHALYMIKRDAGGSGRHEIQHIRSFLVDQAETQAQDSDHIDGKTNNAGTAVGSERAGVPNNRGKDVAEPATCPYKVSDITDSAGQHSRTTQTESDAISESKDEGKLVVGKKPEETVEMPTNTSEKSASESEQVPTETRSSMKSEYELKNDGKTPGGNSQTFASF